MKIQATSLTKIYVQGEKQIYALNDINVSITENKFTAIIGPSGCGKSTFLRALSALEKPSSGTVTYDEQDIYKLTEKKRAELRRRKIGVVYQDYSLLPTLTALENICTPSLMDGRKPDLEYIAGLATILGIEDRLRGHRVGNAAGDLFPYIDRPGQCAGRIRRADFVDDRGRNRFH